MSTIESPNFDEMSIAKLREYAAHLRIAIPRTADKDYIKEAIHNKLRNKTMAQIAEPTSEVPPGYAKIQINQDPMPGAENFPVYINANGYIATIPRGIPVIVPRRVVRVLNDAVAHRRRQSEGGPGQPIKETVQAIHSYPFTVLEMTPGPEPLTRLEESKKKTMGPRRRYRAQFGHWPTPRELTRAIERGIITLDNETEELSRGTTELLAQSSDMIDNN